MTATSLPLRGAGGKWKVKVFNPTVGASISSIFSNCFSLLFA